MNKPISSLLLLSFIFLQNIYASSLYGIVTTLGGSNTQTVVLTVEINNATGAFQQVTENFIYVGSSGTYDGISTFDQKKKFLFYSTNYESSFVFGVDVAHKDLLPPISIGSSSVSSVNWDGKNEQLLINGYFEDDSSAIVTVPYDGPSEVLVNFTTLGVSPTEATFLDWAKETFYFVYYKTSESQFYIGSFSLSNPSKLQSQVFGCSLAPDDLFVDSTNGQLFGIGFDSKSKTYQYFRIVNNKCTVTNLGFTGVVTVVTYDPTDKSLYLGLVQEVGPSLVKLDATSAKVLAKNSVQYVLEELQVSYSV